MDLAKAQIAAKREHESSLKLLSFVWSSSEAPYAIRAAAAQALGQLKAKVSSPGSAELNLLARGGSTDVVSAEQPGFYYARVQAAERVSDMAVRVRLLLDALAINPQDQGPRIPLFHDAVGAGQYQLAFSALEPLLSEGAAGSYRYAYQVSVQEGSEYAGAQAYANSSEPVEFLPQVEFSADQKAALPGQVAEVLERLHRLREAITYWDIAMKLEPESSRAESQRRLDQAKVQVRLDEQDAMRRPVVTEHLEQKGLVRPRLAAKADARQSVASGGRGR